ncbi:hypothetical protein ACWEWX_44765 [Streptomyces asiaticus]
MISSAFRGHREALRQRLLRGLTIRHGRITVAWEHLGTQHAADTLFRDER